MEEEIEDEDSSIMNFEKNKTNIMKRHLSIVDPPERDECFNCFKS